MVRSAFPKIAVLLALGAATAHASDRPTQFRKRHTIVLAAKEGERIAVKVTCVSASSGYVDSAGYLVLNPFGRKIEQGEASVGKSETVSFVARTAGPHVLDVDPGMNAFTIEPSTAAWAVDLSEKRQLNLIAQARNVYFWVPRGVASFTFKMQGEPGRVKVCDGEGRVVCAKSLPLYEQVEILISVPKGQGGCAWHLELDLREDQGIVFPPAIPPYVAERPLTEATLEDFRGGRGLTRFDLQVVPSGGLTLDARPNAAHRVQSGDGLALAFSSSGQLADVRADGNTAWLSGIAPLGGFFIKDVAAGPDLVAVRSKFEETTDGLRQTGQFPGTDISLEATLSVKPDHIAVSGAIEDTTGKDRAVSLYFALPVAGTGKQWWDTIDDVRTIDGKSEYGHYSAARFGANGKSSVYPFGCVGGLALGIPLNRPCINRIAFSSAAQQLYTVFDFALTPATTKFPQRASFSFVIYRHDAWWGLRGAAKKYYGIFGDLIEKRMKRDGGWVCWGDTRNIEPIADLGFLYHWGPGGAPAVAYDDKTDIYSFLYNDSVRFFSDLDTFPKKPGTEACTKVFNEYLNTPDPRSFVLSRPTKATGRRRYEGLERKWGREQAEAYLKQCVAAVRRSAARDKEGNFIVGYVINRKDWGPPNWWTGRLFCNPDPDLPDGYGQFLLNEVIGRTFRDYREQGGELDGVGLDNYFTNARYPNYRREHFAYVDYPLTFSQWDLRPVQVGDFALYEWVDALAARMRSQGKFVMANMGVFPFPFAAHPLDMHGYEWNIERVAPTARLLAYHKPVVTLPVRDQHYTEAWIRKHVRFGFLPGGYASGSRFGKKSKLRTVYRKYVPVIRALASAGWEPITHATVDVESIRLERFGGDGGRSVYFTVHNGSDDVVVCSVRVGRAASDLTEKAIKPSVLLCGEVRHARTDADEITVALTIPAQSTSVLTFGGER